MPRACTDSRRAGYQLHITFDPFAGDIAPGRRTRAAPHGMVNTMHESMKAFLALKARALEDLALPKTNHRDSAPKTIRLGSWEVGIYVNFCITNAQCLQ
jgi:hypothetical protein